jgi:hypothetical protein
MFRHLLPPEARAALPTRNPYAVLATTPLLTVWKAHGPDGKRHTMIQRGELGPPPPGCGVADCASREEVVAQLQQVLSHHPGGISVAALHEALRWDCCVGVRTHWRNLVACLAAYPQLFVVEQPARSDADFAEGAQAAVAYLNNAKRYV